MNETVIAQLAELGLTRNEALAYVTLLEDGDGDGLTGYEVAARSGIPRSAVYTVLRKLESNGGAFSFGENPARYAPIGPDAFVDHFRRSTLSQLDAVSRALQSLPKHPRHEPIRILSRYDEVLDQIATMVRGAEASIYLSLWPRELDRLRGALASVADRDLHRVLHSPATVPDPPAGFDPWDDSVADDEAKAKWSHKALVVVDRREALIGGTEPDAENHAVWTTNPSLVDVATNHIILDITLMSRRSGRDCVGVVSPMMRPHLTKAG
ncbi:MAG: TrmB family transcriptional regulator [Alphaproteobacteria bacterium]|nr:TrmB family transcriptional regulator [Alphaproteobacteria bacterium]